MTLMRNQRDFHLGDELLMEPGGACPGKVVKEDGGARLAVGKMSYRVIIVPPGITLAENTVRLLREFTAAGGTILAIEPKPILVNGRPANEPPIPASAKTVTIESIPAALDETLPFDVRIADRPSIWAQHRRIDGNDVYFLANTDQDCGGVATVQLRTSGHVEEWDPATGLAHDLPSRQRGGVTEVVLDFPPVGSHLLVVHPGEAPVPVKPAVASIVAEMALPNTWQVVSSGDNALTLDTAEVQIAGGEWSRPLHILDAHGVVARAGIGSPFALRFSLAADVAPKGHVYLAVESPELFTISVNGKPISNANAGWWVDTAFRKVDLGRTIKAGRNEITMSGTFTRGVELESVYLVGAFGVATRRLKEENRFNGQVFDRYAPEMRLVAPAAAVTAAGQPGGLAVDLTQQGFAFFAGRVVLRQVLTLAAEPEQAQLEIAGLRAALARVRVNGKDSGVMAWQPHQVELGGLRAGRNVIELELVGTLRNLLGPHHRSGGDLAGTGPDDFRDKSRWTDDYILVPFGFDQVTLKLLAP